MFVENSFEGFDRIYCHVFAKIDAPEKKKTQK